MGLRILDNADLSDLNTFGVKATAKRLVILDDDSRLGEARRALDGYRSRFILGGGSNVLFVDDVDGAVLLIRTRGRRVLERGPDGYSRVAIKSGEPWDDTVRWTLACSLPGLENLSMIPGTAGAAAIQNIGAYGVELSDRFDSLLATHLDTGENREFDREHCQFGYRDSFFKQPGGQAWLIRELRLTVGAAFRPVLNYADLSRAFGEQPATPPSALVVAERVREIRARKLPDPAVIGNAGSFFKNPVVSARDAERLRTDWPELPMHPTQSRADAGAVKLPAAWLIERCGWKGYRHGQAGVHDGHALVLVNHGGASGRDLRDLAEKIRVSVHERFGVWLEPEPVFVGGDIIRATSI